MYFKYSPPEATRKDRRSLRPTRRRPHQTEFYSAVLKTMDSFFGDARPVDRWLAKDGRPVMRGLCRPSPQYRQSLERRFRPSEMRREHRRELGVRVLELLRCGAETKP